MQEAIEIDAEQRRAMGLRGGNRDPGTIAVIEGGWAVLAKTEIERKLRHEALAVLEAIDGDALATMSPQALARESQDLDKFSAHFVEAET